LSCERLLPGGDYGFPFNPNGRNVGRGDELGQVREGFLADLLLVDGDPTFNVVILQNENHLNAIMKDGRFYKSPA
jgi:imidazolonepropionase-like amidohydrolase